MTIIDARPTCFYHPIKVIFLDDNRAFLDALDLEFGEKLNILTLTSSDMAFHLIDNDSQDVTQSIFKLMNDVNLDTTNDRFIGFDVSKMLNLIYSKARFEHAPLLVVDYQMPAINGIEFCKKIKEKKIFKIMLTAEADKDTAIKAFNNGLIDKFILKTSENLYPEITLAVDDLTQRYFRELTKNIVNAYENSINDLFDNELYQQLFASVLIQAQAVEYYLVDNSGSFLFLDKDAKPTWLIIRHAKELSEQLDLMQGYELPEQTMAAVVKKEKILFLLSEKEYKKPIAEWINYLFDTQKLDNNYYYSITKDHLTDSLDWGRVVSYSSYLAER
ncbi:TPA: response regulator [Legionella pneumophila subsp. pneumophila]|uniref:response regulator n=1 Tax=Legionella pneumophila TaxID=446 RepID=UPI0007707727|nr:response regulator [Legionella pneumophila]HAT9059563.1 response regulator [Legionella pneumophila subsp. pneumophila]CZG71366.1 response regulator FixJ [Legionella pneumophila]CZG75382.1 response regulator FixJ [Legionella pneumophila]CZG93549.1 response regulator FixJ [Legionella pneumophila]HAT8609245.1 response regulator [Legionella pneumophila]